MVAGSCFSTLLLQHITTQGKPEDSELLYTIHVKKSDMLYNMLYANVGVKPKHTVYNGHEWSC